MRTEILLIRFGLISHTDAVSQVLMGGGKTQQKVELKEVKEKQTIARSQLLRGAHVFLTEGAFRQRKAYLTAKVGSDSRSAVCWGVMPA